MSEDKTKTLAMDEIKTPTTQPMLDVILERLNNLYHQNEASQLLIEELRSDVKSRFDVLEAQQNELRSDMKSRFDVLEAQLNEFREDIKKRFS